jgi:hypothetical protein
MKTHDKQKNKDYQKPSWEKQQLFERFTMGCNAKQCNNAGLQNQLKT